MTGRSLTFPTSRSGCTCRPSWATRPTDPPGHRVANPTGTTRPRRRYTGGRRSRERDQRHGDSPDAPGSIPSSLVFGPVVVRLGLSRIAPWIGANGTSSRRGDTVYYNLLKRGC